MWSQRWHGWATSLPCFHQKYLVTFLSTYTDLNVKGFWIKVFCLLIGCNFAKPITIHSSVWPQKAHYTLWHISSCHTLVYYLLLVMIFLSVSWSLHSAPVETPLYLFYSWVTDDRIVLRVLKPIANIQKMSSEEKVVVVAQDWQWLCTRRSRKDWEWKRLSSFSGIHETHCFSSWVTVNWPRILK